MSKCDMGCQPDWHRDDCAIYLPDDPMTAPDTQPAPASDWQCPTCGKWVNPYAHTCPDPQPAPASGEREALREALHSLVFAGRHGRYDGLSWQDHAYRIASDHARLVAERDEAREKVRRVEALAELWEQAPGDATLVLRAAEDIRAALGGEQAGD